MARTVSSSAQEIRDPDLRDMDRTVLKEIAQAAVDVELFTIPLYMTSLYSIEGWHPITGRNSQLYQGRIWPGAKSSAEPKTDNERAFNIVFSVFIQEMLHLQMAANMASVVGVHPDFERLQDGEYGWPCYGPNNTVIPHIIDLKDTKSSADLKVNVGPLDEERIRLFLAIEAPEKVAQDDIPEANKGKYFPKAPFADWYPAQGLPLFGTIGWMYQCYYDYLNLKYEDGVSMWDAIWADIQAGPAPVQNDLFNAVSGGHPMREFMGFNTVVATTYPDIALSQMVAMMDAITDQGEGSVLEKHVQLLTAVEPIYCPDDDALRSDYPSYDDKGALIPSADAAARFGNDSADHYERFTEVKAMIDAKSITTWDRKGAPRVFTADELQTADWATNPYKDNMPAPDAVADALTRMSADAANSRKVLSEAVVGAIAGVTTVLGDYWNPQGTAPLFPYPSMVGSGDRMAIAWAVLGACPDLRKGVGTPAKNVLRHACQGLAFESAGGNSCADPKIFHSCKGSNNCHAQGGCGFVQLVTGGGNCSSSGGGGSGGGGSNCSSNGCSSSALSLRAFGGLCGGPPPPPTPSGGPLYSAPSDNKCKGFGGCAVPISASQLYPTQGTMQIFAFDTIDGKITSAPIGTLDYKIGDAVADIAYAAFAKAVAANHKQPKPQPPANDLRLVFPPST
ncbi:MAG TPA: ferritin-like domain-containing protein [Allosphingosinicella sp.]|jgi:hypothetical protein